MGVQSAECRVQSGERMPYVKETEFFAAELEVVAEHLLHKYWSEELRAAAERLRDLEKIAEYYRIKYENERKER